MSSIPSPTKPTTYSIQLTVTGPVEDPITLAADELKTAAKKYGEVESEVIGKQKFKLDFWRREMRRPVRCRGGGENIPGLIYVMRDNEI